MKKAQNDLYHIPAVYRGKSYVTRECITGKLAFWAKDGHAAHPHATIAVLTPETEAKYLASGDDASTVAAVFIGEHPSEALCAHACAKELPLLILGKLSAAHDGRIAILDTRNATLFVDPDLETLERYARHLRLSTDPRLLSLLPSLYTCHCAVPILEKSTSSLFERGKMLMTDGNDRLLAIQTEEELFDRLRELAETAVGVPLIVGVRVYDLHSERALASLQSRLRALLRAAVYGSFSLLFEGLYCAEQVKQTFSLLNRICGELSDEGREYDRHLPRGIAVESFLLLQNLGDCPHFDYLCLNGDRLWQSAIAPYTNKGIPIEVENAFGAMLKNYTHSVGTPICLRSDHAPEACPWYSTAAAINAHALFVPEKHLAEWCESL